MTQKAKELGVGFCSPPFLILTLTHLCADPALANGNCPTFQDFLSSRFQLESPHQQFLNHLGTPELLEEPRSFVSFINSQGQRVRARIAKQFKFGGREKLLLVEESGLFTVLDPVQEASLQFSSESHHFWMQKTQEVKDVYFNVAELTDALTGDYRFATYIDRTREPHQVRILNVRGASKELSLVVQDSQGQIFGIHPKSFNNLSFTPESKRVFLESQLQDGQVALLEKHHATLAKRKTELLQSTEANVYQPIDFSQHKKIGISNVGSQRDVIWPAHSLETEANPKLKRIAKSIKKNFNTEVVYSPRFNEAENVNGSTASSAVIHNKNDIPIKPGEVVFIDPLTAQGHSGDTLVHEGGHLQTTKNLEAGIPEPGGIWFEARLGHTLDTGGNSHLYASGSHGDESEQWALNFINSIQQRHASELGLEFRTRGQLKTYEAYGVNLNNFIESMHNANHRLEHLETFNRRHLELSKRASETIEQKLNDGNSARFFEIEKQKTKMMSYLNIHLKNETISIPIVGNAYREVLKPIEIKQYALDYLANEITQLENQKLAIDESKKIVERLQAQPHRPITQAEYLTNKNIFIKVKSSVNFSLDKIKNLLWVIPAK